YDADEVQEDHKWLEVTGSVFLNEAILEEYANLPSWDYSEYEPVDRENGGTSLEAEAVEAFPGSPPIPGREMASVQRMLQLLRQGGNETGG
ncbi:unnamed protein product, partial [Discosporangium mesarthrocarpum]